MNLQEAYARCTKLAETHYENFPVGRLVPKALRPHVHAVYAFARVADDFADEGYVASANYTSPSQEQRTASLKKYQDQLTDAILGKKLAPEHEWIFLPVADTIKKFDVPPSLFYDLLSAFQQDVVKNRYENFDEVLDYCRRSANPVGRLVLYLHGYRGEKEHQLSDYICTALQLANFWQDVAVDVLKNRIYIPRNDQRAFGLDEKTLFLGIATPEFRKCLEFQVQRTREIFFKGRNLPRMLGNKLAREIRLTWLGGMTILEKIEKQNFDTLACRPKLKIWDVIRLVPRAWFTRHHCP